VSVRTIEKRVESKKSIPKLERMLNERKKPP
jgi:hypothetical protein